MLLPKWRASGSGSVTKRGQIWQPPVDSALSVRFWLFSVASRVLDSVWTPLSGAVGRFLKGCWARFGTTCARNTRDKCALPVGARGEVSCERL